MGMTVKADLDEVIKQYEDMKEVLHITHRVFVDNCMEKDIHNMALFDEMLSTICKHEESVKIILKELEIEKTIRGMQDE